jgi:signal peptidase I
MKPLREIIAIIVLAIAIFFALQLAFSTSIVVGYSMEPDFHQGQRLLINKVVYHLHEPQRGDVIIFYSPNNPQAEYIKRIIGLPGESIEIKEGIVYIYQNGDALPLDEPYIQDPPAYTLTKQEIPDNEYFVLGDNRNNSDDSHKGWTVPRQNIIGKTWLSIWPPAEWGLAPNYSLYEATSE